MSHAFSEINIATLSPMQKMELADMLYNAVLQEIEATQPMLDAQQRQELDRRISRLHNGEAILVPWDAAYATLTANR